MKRIELEPKDFFWILERICALFRKPFSLSLAQQQFPPPHHQDSLSEALSSYGFHAGFSVCSTRKLPEEPLPFLVFLKNDNEINAMAGEEDLSPALVLQMDADQVCLIRRGESSPGVMGLADFFMRFCGQIMRISLSTEKANDADRDDAGSSPSRFGFRWFVPELL